MDTLFIPTFSFWLNRNSWYGNLGQARFYIKPISLTADDGSEQTQLQVQLWKGPLTLDLSQVLDTVYFPLTEEAPGLPAMKQWLVQQAQRINQID